MKSIIKLWYKRPYEMDTNAELETVIYQRLSSAIDAAQRLALMGYYVQVIVDGHVVLTWEENFIKDIYHY